MLKIYTVGVAWSLFRRLLLETVIVNVHSFLLCQLLLHNAPNGRTYRRMRQQDSLKQCFRRHRQVAKA